MMLQTLRMLGQLSPAERATIESGQFAGDFTVDALLDQMRTLAQFDASNDATRASLTKWAGAMLVLMFASLFLFKVVGPIAGVLTGALLVVAIILAVAGRRLGRVDIANNFREVALPFLAVVKQDMDHDQTLSVRIDLRSPTDDRKRKGSGKPYKAGVYTNIVDTNYHDAWFHGTARLADGSLLRWDVADDICQSKRTKRSSSGKSKTKTRSYKRTVVSIALSVTNKRYGVNEGLQSSRHKVAVTNGAKRRTIKLTRKIKTKSLDPVDPAVLIDAVSSAYKRVVAPARSAA
jgi:hypothetical protein